MIRQLSSIQRQASLSATGAIRKTPTAAQEVILNILPLHIYIQGVANSVTCRRYRCSSPISPLLRHDYCKLHREREMLPKRSFHQAFNTSIEVLVPNREAWGKEPPLYVEIACYTDGFKTNNGAGTGIYCAKPKPEGPSA